MAAQCHRSDPRILRRRTLERDHRYLATLLRPGLAVLDVGCGTGAITSGIAKAVGPDGHVIGIDRDAALLELARQEHSRLSNCAFAHRDATSLDFHSQFDIVTAARTLQWIAQPGLAVSNMRKATKPSGTLVILDYNHAGNGWEPDPPIEFRRFYSAFLVWRQSNHWDNEMASHLPELFRSAGVIDIQSHIQDEVVERGESEFAERTALWSEVIENVGEQIVNAGLCTDTQLREARECYDFWIKTELARQLLAMRVVTGIAT